MSEPTKLQGRVHYRQATVTLRSGDPDTSLDPREYLLALDNPPFGFFDQREVSSCFNVFRETYEISEGEAVLLLGYPGSLAERYAFGVVRLLERGGAMGPFE
jgi:hypothetical protein